jgi:hypothetical protein
MLVNNFTVGSKKQSEEEDILSFVFDDELLKIIYLNRCKDNNERLSIDGGKIFISEFNFRNGEDFNSNQDPIIERLDISGMKIGLNTIFALTKYVKKNKPIRHLNISNNMIKDYGLYNLKEFFKASMIEGINLSSNMITSVGLSHVVETMSKLSNLRYLNLGVCRNSFAKNNLGLEGAKALKELLITSQSLRTLILEENNLTKESVLLIAEGLGSSKLNELTIRQNEVTSKGLTKILMNGVNLTKLNVADNRISNSSATALANFLVNKNSLTSLNISNNQLNWQTIDYITGFIRTENPLRELKISRCDLSEISIVSLSNLLNQKGLVSLDLSGTQLTFQAIYTVFSSLPNSSLENLNLSHNVISEEVFERRVFSAIKPGLKRLKLCNCGLNDQTLMSLLNYAKRFVDLVEIEAVNNLLTEEVVLHILQILPELKSLQRFALDQNRINLQQRKEINEGLVVNKRNMSDKRPKIMKRTFHKLVYEKENIEKLGENIRMVEERIFKLQEQKKTAEIEFLNDHQNILTNQKQIRDKIEKSHTGLETKQKILKEKESELGHFKHEMQREIDDLSEVMNKNKDQLLKTKSEKERLIDAKKELEDKFEAEYFKKMNLVSELMSEIGRLKTSSDYYLRRINEQMNLQKV